MREKDDVGGLSYKSIFYGSFHAEARQRTAKPAQINIITMG